MSAHRSAQIGIKMIETDKTMKNYYFQKYPLSQWFSFDITPYMELHSFKKNTFICKEDQPMSHLYLLLEGRTKVFTTHDNGKISIIEFNGPMSLIGEMELIHTRSTTVAVQSTQDTVCIGIPLAGCYNQILSDPVFLLKLGQYLGQRIVSNTRNFVSNQAYPLKNRLSAFLVENHPDGIFNEKLAEVSDYLGVSYRHLQRVIAELCNLNVLKRVNDGYEIIDPEYLLHHKNMHSSV